MNRRDLEETFWTAVEACRLEGRVHDALVPVSDDRRGEPVAELRGARARVGIAVGKSALQMARGIAVDRGIVVTTADDGGGLPEGWRVVIAAHPEPDERSVIAGRAVRELVAGATDEDVVVALISGGASALIEQPRSSLDELRAVTHAVMAAGAAIDELNQVRGALSELKGGQLALGCAAPILTLVASDVIGDRLEVVGSGPTIGPWLESPGSPVDAGAHAEARRLAARSILERYRVVVPDVLDRPIPSRVVTRTDRARLVSPISAFAEAARPVAGAHGRRAERRLEPPLSGDVAAIATSLAGRPGHFVGYGEPTVRVPADHGEGGRAQQLALLLAGHLRGSVRCMLVAGTDGIDGPPPRRRPAPAGAFVDGTTWDAIVAAGIDPGRALARCDAGTALHAVGALFVTGPTGVNHADIVLC